MSRGYVYRPTYTYQGEKRQSSVWWAGWSVNGEKQQESTGKRDKEAAERYLTRRLRELDLHGPEQTDYSKVRFSDLAELIEEDYERNNRRSSIGNRLSHLKDRLGGLRVEQIKNDQVDAYVRYRLAQGAANATVNRELACLNRMFVLGRKKKLVHPTKGPDVLDYTLEEDNARKGFFTREQYEKVRDALPARLRPLLTFAYVTGWRKNEILSRNWEHVQGDSIRLEPGETKNKDGRSFPLTADLRRVLERQRERKERVEQKHGCEVEPLFFYYGRQKNGTPAGARIKSFRKAWNTALEEAGCPDRIFHDLRRSSVRQLVRSGVPENVARRLTGHRTRSIFDRYDIVTGTDLREAVDKLPTLGGKEEVENGGKAKS